MGIVNKPKPEDLFVSVCVGTSPDKEIQLMQGIECLIDRLELRHVATKDVEVARVVGWLSEKYRKENG